MAIQNVVFTTVHEGSSETYLASRTGQEPVKIFTITEVALDNLPTRKSQDELDAKQLELKRRNIPLNVSHPPRQEKLNDFNRVEINRYLESLKEKSLKMYEANKAFFDSGADKITIKELEEHLASCTRFLASELKGESYDVGFVRKKSSQWITEQALAHLPHLPSHHFEHSADTLLSSGTQSTLLPGSRKFVVFDDASYSGTQLACLVSALKNEIVSQNREGEIFVVIPFISTRAREKLAHQLKAHFENDERKQPEVHLITSHRKIKVMSDVFPSSSQEGVTITEWKVPDSASLANHVREHIDFETGESFTFVTDFPPCYKK